MAQHTNATSAASQRSGQHVDKDGAAPVSDIGLEFFGESQDAAPVYQQQLCGGVRVEVEHARYALDLVGTTYVWPDVPAVGRATAERLDDAVPLFQRCKSCVAAVARLRALAVEWQTGNVDLPTALAQLSRDFPSSSSSAVDENDDDDDDDPQLPVRFPWRHCKVSRTCPGALDTIYAAQQKLSSSTASVVTVGRELRQQARIAVVVAEGSCARCLAIAETLRDLAVAMQVGNMDNETALEQLLQY